MEYHCREKVLFKNQLVTIIGKRFGDRKDTRAGRFYDIKKPCGGVIRDVPEKLLSKDHFYGLQSTINISQDLQLSQIAPA